MSDSGSHSTAADKFDARIPIWDLKATSFPDFKNEVKWWLKGENLNQPFNIAVRFINVQRDAAKKKGRELDPDDLEPRGVVYDEEGEDPYRVLHVAEPRARYPEKVKP